MDGARASLPSIELPVADYGSATSTVRRDSLGRRQDIASSIWRALDRAVDNAVELLNARSADSALSGCVAGAATAVRRITRRGDDASAIEMPAISPEAIETLRVEFLRQLQL